MNILIRDAERKLAVLDTHAKALTEALAEGGQAQGADVGEYSFNRENLVRAVIQVTSLKARLVSFSINYAILHGQDESLQQQMQEYKSILQSREEELKRTKHILMRA